MNIKLEVCIDNIESLYTVIEFPIARIELCSSLALGGLTPTYSLLDLASKQDKVEVHAMIRPRPGDFDYSEIEIAAMLYEIDKISKFGVNGIVFGVTNNGSINIDASKQIINFAKKLGLQVTFHRAVDLTSDYLASISTLIDLGCTRVLTSGSMPNVELGLERLEEVQKMFGSRIEIMSGGGVTLENISKIASVGITNIHTSSSMFKSSSVKYTLGTSSDDLSYQVTSKEKLTAFCNAIK